MPVLKKSLQLPTIPSFGSECKIPIRLVYKGPKYKRFSGFFWRLVQEDGNQSVIPGQGQPLPPTAPGRGEGGMEGGMEGRTEGWEPG